MSKMESIADQLEIGGGLKLMSAGFNNNWESRWCVHPGSDRSRYVTPSFGYIMDELKFPEELGLASGTDFAVVVLDVRELEGVMLDGEVQGYPSPHSGKEHSFYDRDGSLGYNNRYTMQYERVAVPLSSLEDYVSGLDSGKHKAFLTYFEYGGSFSCEEDSWDEPAQLVIQIFGPQAGMLRELQAHLDLELTDPDADDYVSAEQAEDEQEMKAHDDRMRHERQMTKRFAKVEKLQKKLAKLSPFERKLIIESFLK